MARGAGAKLGRIDGEGLIFVAKIQVLLQIPGIDRLPGRPIATIFFDLDIPPPFFDRIEAAAACCVI